MLTEIVLNHPSSQRSIDGIARMNYLHSRHRKSGKITDDDLLYTLSLFALEPIRWTKRYDWREVSQAERCALGVFWRWIGEAMEIPYTALKSQSGWPDGIDFLEELEEWSLAYETEHMVPAETNRTVASATVDIALYNAPKALRGEGFISVLLGPRARKAMMFREPWPFTIRLFSAIVLLRKAFIRHLCLPRPYFLRCRWLSEGLNEHGRFNAEEYMAHPWYIKPTLFSRWGLKALSLRLVGGAVPGDEGDKYLPRGYLTAELGPDHLRNKGEPDMQATRERLSRNHRIGCPFLSW